MNKYEVQVTVRELTELLELLRAFIEETPLMLDLNHINNFEDNPQVRYNCIISV